MREDAQSEQHPQRPRHVICIAQEDETLHRVRVQIRDEPLVVVVYDKGGDGRCSRPLELPPNGLVEVGGVGLICLPACDVPACKV